MARKKVSKELSMIGWDLLTYIKDRRKGAIAVIAGAIAFAISDSEVAAVISGVVFEGLISVAEFYLRRIELN